MASISRVSRFLPLIIVLALQSQLLRAAPATLPAEEKFIRLIDIGRAGGHLDCAVVTYENRDGAKVDLVSAVHIGEKSYYAELNKSFEKYDAVLYEMVKSKEDDAPKQGAKSDNPINKIQHLMKDALNLEFQLDGIDYTRPNFVHADMDAETFARFQKERGETFPQLFLRAMMKAMSEPDKATDKDPKQMLKDLIAVLTRPDGERQLKLALARQMQDMEAAASGFAGPNGESVIVTERNKKAMEVFKKTLESGKKNMAIFYGAAHMPDLSNRIEEMGFKPVKTKYIVAWDLTIRADQPSMMEKLLNEALKVLDE